MHRSLPCVVLAVVLALCSGCARSGFENFLTVGADAAADAGADAGSTVGTSPYAGGTGTHDDPFLIATAQQLAAVAAHPEHFLSSFVLTTSVDLGGVAFDGIGSAEHPFGGRFLGNGESISNLAISRGTGDDVGLFNVAENAFISDLTLVDATVTAPGSTNAAILIGQCSQSQIVNLELNNLELAGSASVGSIMGTAYGCSVLGARLSGTVTGTGSEIGGLFGAVEHGKFFNIDSTVNVQAPLATSVGGVVGAEWWSHPDLQNAHIAATVVGNQYVGGILGENTDGFFILRSSFTGSVRGNSDVGGVVGVNWDVPFNVYSTSVDANIFGNQNVGGLAGQSSEGARYHDSYALGSVNGVGSGQANLGGFWGYVSYYGSIYRSYAAVAIQSTAERVGGAVGYIDYWDASYDLFDSFVAGSVEGTSASDTISLFLGQNDDPNPLAASNSYYWSGATCTNNGTGSCNTATATGRAALADFYDPAQAPLAAWDFDAIWVAQAGALPTLNLQQYYPPTVSHACAGTAGIGVPYLCLLTIADADLNEEEMIVLQPAHSCRWLHADENILRGTPAVDDAGTCAVSFVVTDGANSTAVQSFTIRAPLGVTIAPVPGWDGYYSFGFQGIDDGVKSVLFTLTNLGPTPATDVAISGIPAAGFIFAGGAYPGAGGNCTDTLAAGASCSVEVGFDPAVSGEVLVDMFVEFDSGQGLASYAVQLRGVGM